MKRYHLNEQATFSLLVSGILLLLFGYYYLWQGLLWGWHWIAK